MKPRSIVFDLFGDYLRYRGGQVPLRQLIALLGQFDVAPSTARVVMTRLRREGWFDTRPGATGREVVYALNERSWRMLDEGRERIFGDPRGTWEGWWYMVIYYVPENARATREELRKELAWLGFGPLAASTWVSPHDRLARVGEKFSGVSEVRIDLLRARSKGLPADRGMAERSWDLVGLNADYAAFLEQYRARLPRYRSRRLSPDEALRARTALVHDYRLFPFRDPALPVELLPAGWLGTDAYDLFMEGAELLRSGAEEAVDGIVGPGRGAGTGPGDAGSASPGSPGY